MHPAVPQDRLTFRVEDGGPVLPDGLQAVPMRLPNRELLHEWTRLEEQIADVGVTESSAWLKVWLAHYGQEVPHEFVAFVDRGGELAGLAVLTSRKSGGAFGIDPRRTIHLGTGASHPSDPFYQEYTRSLVRPEARPAVSNVFLDWIQLRRDWDVLCFDGYSSEDFEGFAQASCVVVEERTSPYFDFGRLPAEGELIESLGRSTRSNLKRMLNRLSPTQLEWAESVEIAQEMFDDLIRLHQERWESVGQPGTFACSRVTAWCRDLISELHPLGKVVVVRVRSGDSVIGCALLLNDRGRLLDYLAGMDMNLKKQSPGLVMHYLAMCEAHRRGYRAYDFLAGEQRHKKNLSNATATLYWGRILRPSLRNRAIDAVKVVKNRMGQLLSSANTTS